MDRSPNNDTAKQRTTVNDAFFWGLVLAIMFLLGAAVGFMGRPLLIQDLPVEVAVTVIPDAEGQSMAQANQSQNQTPAQSPASQLEEEANASSATPTIMDLVLSDARHIQGSADAPVTMIEFSDFK